MRCDNLVILKRMENAPNSSTMSFGSLEEEQRYKRLQRLIKQTHKGVCSLSGRNDFETTEATEASLNISSIAPESHEFHHLQTRELLETSKTGSYVIASSNNPRREHLDGLIGKATIDKHRQALATSSVKGKGHWKGRKEALCCTHNSSSPGQIQRQDDSREMGENLASCDDKLASINHASSYQLSSCGRRVGHSSHSETRVGACFTHWTIMLNDQSKLVIKGNLIGGSYCQSKPVLRKASAKMVQTTNKCLYTLVGNINDENHELPRYVREKFYDGFPDDWENVYQVWLAFNRQGSPPNFHWPTDLADSDDDLRSEITDDTVDCSVLSLMQLPTHTTTTTLKRGGMLAQQTRENHKVAKGIFDSEKRAQVNYHITTDNAVSASPPTNLATKSVDFEQVALPQSNQSLAFSEELDALYKKFQNLFDRLRLTCSKREEATSLLFYQEASAHPGKVTRPAQTLEDNNRLNGAGSRGEEATLPMSIRVETSAIESNDYQSPERPSAKISVNSDESESEMYAGVRKMPLKIILSQRSRRQISDERKRLTTALIPRKSRDTYVRRTRRIRNVNSCPIYSSEEKEANDGEDRVGAGAEASFPLQSKYREEKANACPRATSTRDTIPLSHIDSGMNVELQAAQFNIRHASTSTSTSNQAKPHLQEQWGSMPMPSRCASAGPDAKDVAPSNSPLYSPIANKKEHSLASFYSSCQPTSTTISQTIGQESRIPVDTAQLLIAVEQLAHHRTAASTLETTAKSSQEIVGKSPTKRNRPPVHRVSTGKSTHDSNASAKGNSSVKHNKGLDEEEKETAAHLSKEKVDGQDQQVTRVQLLKSWLPRVVRKSSSDLDGDLIFHGQLINGAGHLVRRNVTTSSVRRRLSRSRIETVDSQVYELVGEMVDPRNTVPKRLLTQCRHGCPSRIQDFCKAWLTALLPTMKDTKLAATPPGAHDASMEKLNVPVSSKGRRILPPLSYWTGERVLLKDNNPVYSPGIVIDRKEGEKNQGTTRNRDGTETSGKRTRLSTAADANDERSPPSTKKRRIISSGCRMAGSVAIPAEPPKNNPTSTTRRSKQIIHLSRMEQPAHHRAPTVKLLDATHSDQEQLGDYPYPVTTAPVQKLRKSRGRITRGNTTHEEKFNVMECPDDNTRRESCPRAPCPCPNLNSATVKRRRDQVSYNLYKNCPSQEDALSDDQLSHV